jgi:hypothetical protein
MSPTFPRGPFLYLDEHGDWLTVMSGNGFFGTRAHEDMLAWLRDVGIEPDRAISDCPVVRRDRSVTYTEFLPEPVPDVIGNRREVTIELDRDTPPFPDSVIAVAKVTRHPSRLSP